MDKEQAQQHALQRASGALYAYLEEGSIENHYQELSAKDIKSIEIQFKQIIIGLEKRIKRTV